MGTWGDGHDTLTPSCVMCVIVPSPPRFGIRCNAVLPGFIVTPMTDKVPPKVLEKVIGGGGVTWGHGGGDTGTPLG